MARNPSVNQPFVDPQTGVIRTEWLRYLVALESPIDRRLAAPVNPAESDSYYDLTLHKARTWDGTTWQNWW
jgi:hypothetical protein